MSEGLGENNRRNVLSNSRKLGLPRITLGVIIDEPLPFLISHYSTYLQIRVPESMTMEEAAALGVGITSAGRGLYQTPNLAMPTATATPILIYGGSTASGALSIQFARLSGYAPITTCSPHNFAMVNTLGAVAAFHHRDSAEAKQQIREYTKSHILTLAWDTISTQSSAQFCADVLAAGAGAQYASLLPAKFPRSGVKSAATLAYTLFVERIMDGGNGGAGAPEGFRVREDVVGGL